MKRWSIETRGEVKATELSQIELPLSCGRADCLLLGLRKAKSSSYHSAKQWLQAGSRTVAWFWMPQPSQNPWYWIWAISLLPFALSKSGLTVSGFVLVYCLCFWVFFITATLHSNTTVGGPSCFGWNFFDLCVTGIEFRPLLSWRQRSPGVATVLPQANSRIRSSALLT